MPPSIPGAKHLPGHPATVFESTAQKWSTLSPWAQQPCWDEQSPSWNQWGYNWSHQYRPYLRRSWTEGAWTSSRASDYHQATSATTWTDSQTTPASARPRADASCVRNLIRGTTEDAIAALQSLGIDEIIENLNSDRYAASSASSNKSHVRTWSLFHFEVF